MNKPIRIVAMGLPKAGKTTFLAALWHVTESEEVAGTLKLERISDDAKHLNSIKNDWLRFQPMVRTVPGQEQSASLLLCEPTKGKIGELIFPDLSGESFEAAWAERYWSEEYDRIVSGAESLLVFIHPTVKEPYTVADIQKLAEAALAGEFSGDQQTEGQTGRRC